MKIKIIENHFNNDNDDDDYDYDENIYKIIIVTIRNLSQLIRSYEISLWISMSV